MEQERKGEEEERMGEEGGGYKEEEQEEGRGEQEEEQEQGREYREQADSCESCSWFWPHSGFICCNPLVLGYDPGSSENALFTQMKFFFSCVSPPLLFVFL